MRCDIALEVEVSLESTQSDVLSVLPSLPNDVTTIVAVIRIRSHAGRNLAALPLKSGVVRRKIEAHRHVFGAKGIDILAQNILPIGRVHDVERCCGSVPHTEPAVILGRNSHVIESA